MTDDTYDGQRASYKGNYGVITKTGPATANGRPLLTLTYDVPVNSGHICGCHKDGHLYNAVHATPDKFKFHRTL